MSFLRLQKWEEHNKIDEPRKAACDEFLTE